MCCELYCNSSCHQSGTQKVKSEPNYWYAFSINLNEDDIISDNEDGLLVQNGDINSYVYKLTLLMDDASLRQRMSTAGRKNVERFKMEHIGDSWKKLFEGLYE